MSADGQQLPEPPLRRGLRVVAVSLIVALAGGCDGVTDLERNGEALVQTDALTYTLRETPGGRGLEAEIPYRYENRTNSTICMENCRGSFRVGLVDDSGEIVWSPIVLLCRSTPITFAAGETYRDTLHVFHGLESNLHPQFEGDPEGTFRIEILSAGGPGESCQTDEVPRDLRVSNSFKLERE